MRYETKQWLSSVWEFICWAAPAVGALVVLAGIVTACIIGLVGCPGHDECLRSAQHWADRTPGAASVECGGSNLGYRYCTIFRKDGPPISMRCDEHECTTMPAPESHSTTVIYSGGGR